MLFRAKGPRLSFVMVVRIGDSCRFSENMFEGREQADGYLFFFGFPAPLFLRNPNPCAAFQAQCFYQLISVDVCKLHVIPVLLGSEFSH